MQVFVPYISPLEIAECLDKKRLTRQISEAKLILDGIDDKNGWKNNVVVKMWKPYRNWLYNYWLTLYYYNLGDIMMAIDSDNYCIKYPPKFLNDNFCNQHKRRLYTKNPQHYYEFANYGESYENWYYLDNKIIKYNTLKDK